MTAIANAFDLTGQRIFIAGAGGAIGGAAARACATLGGELLLADLRPLDALVDELRADGVKVTAYALDNTRRDDVDAAFREIGTPDALCDCSGYVLKGDWLDGGDDWEAIYRRTLDINVLGPLNLVRAVLPSMMERRFGRIALTTSMAARNAGSTLGSEPAYVASKGGIQALVRYFARQAAAHGVVVNAIAPGPVQSPLMAFSGQSFDLESYPMKRFGQPEEIGWPMAFLCSRATGFITGAVIDINGGIAFS